MASAAVTRPADASGAATSETRVNINTAGLEELQRIKGIGPALAERIVQDRQNKGPYRSPEELVRVKGIGPKTLEKIRPQVTLGR